VQISLECLHQRALKLAELGLAAPHACTSGASSPGALSHFLTVLRDSPVALGYLAVGELVTQLHAPDLAYHFHGDHLLALLLKSPAG
jgi:hypothetical protein